MVCTYTFWVFDNKLIVCYLDRITHLQGSNGTLLSPYYPETYLQGIEVSYYVQVPAAHVMLNFTEMELSAGRYSRDLVTVYDGNSTSDQAELGSFDGDTVPKLPRTFIGSGNVLTVRFIAVVAAPQGKPLRFKALYTMETKGMLFRTSYFAAHTLRLI